MYMEKFTKIVKTKAPTVTQSILSFWIVKSLKHNHIIYSQESANLILVVKLSVDFFQMLLQCALGCLMRILDWALKDFNKIVSKFDVEKRHQKLFRK